MNEETIDEEELQKVISKIEVTFKPNEQGCSETFLNGENVEKQIRTLEVANGASRVSTLKFVREHLVALQREMGSNKGVVMDGRDIGTVVFPDAELKIFLTASPEVRAKRRYDELKQKGMEQPFDEVLSNLKERDFRDQNRKESPLKQADDALLLDNSSLTLQEQTEWLLARFQEKTQ